MIVAFKKGGGFPFYSFPMSTLADTVAEADLVLGMGIHDLREQLLAAKSSRRMFQLVESFLLCQAGEGIHDSIPTTCVQHALLSIIHSPAVRCLHELSEQIGYSQKHFIDLFKAQVGVSPKQYLKIMRFQKAIRAIERDELPRWNQIALECGYYDQAHFIHDFKLFSGFTPNEYLKRKTPLRNYIPVG